MSYAVGLMSGTSLDGIDAALVEINGVSEETEVNLIHFVTLDFEKEMIKSIKEALSLDSSNSALLSSLNFKLGYLFAEAVKQVCQEADVSLDNLDFVASHGQTLYHIPNETEEYGTSTLQLGESSVICEEIEATVVSDFRTRDMAVGGQGAPIVPYSEYVLYRDTERTRLLQNVGGIGNVTVIPPNAPLNEIIAFDTGPGNMVINQLCHEFYQEEYDDEGKHATNGKPNEELLELLMNHPYVKKAPPKTTGREEFGKEFVDNLLAQRDMKPDDWIATATMFTAQTIVRSVQPYVTENTDLIISGGGSYNKTLLKMIQEELPLVNVITQEDIGYSSEAKEAIAMVILGNQTLHREPSNVPNATGAKRPVILGKVTYYA